MGSAVLGLYRAAGPVRAASVRLVLAAGLRRSMFVPCCVGIEQTKLIVKLTVTRLHSECWVGPVVGE
jgi:hypothetical protein